MFTMENLVQPQTLDEAYKILMEKRRNTILGGCAFLRMSSRAIATGIDLSRLNLDYIKEDDTYIEIGAMTNFRDIEVSPLLNKYFNGILPKAVGKVVGVQFRNIVTVGATVFSKYGFSDLITALLALDTEVELYNSGRMSLEEFMDIPYKKDILTRLFIKKNNRKATFCDLRNSVSDYAILNVAVSSLDDHWIISVGARPSRAKIAKKASEELSKKNLTEKNIENAARMAVQELTFQSNMRGSENYRKSVCYVMIKRAVKEVLRCK